MNKQTIIEMIQEEENYEEMMVLLALKVLPNNKYKKMASKYVLECMYNNLNNKGNDECSIDNFPIKSILKDLIKINGAIIKDDEDVLILDKNIVYNEFYKYNINKKLIFKILKSNNLIPDKYKNNDSTPVVRIQEKTVRAIAINKKEINI